MDGVARAAGLNGLSVAWASDGDESIQEQKSLSNGGGLGQWFSNSTA